MKRINLLRAASGKRAYIITQETAKSGLQSAEAEKKGAVFGDSPLVLFQE